MQKVFLGILFVVLISTILFLLLSRSPETTKNYDEFAKCLADKQLTMYGADWCSHCQTEKARFGSAFKYVPYVECPSNVNLCLEKGITGYPTWITADGHKYEGEQGLDGLANISSCMLP